MQEVLPKSFNITSRIKNLMLIDFSLDPITQSELGELNPSIFGFENNVNFSIEPALKQLTFQYTARIYSNEQLSKKLGEIQTFAEFELLNMDDFKSEDQISLPEELLAMFIGIVLSSTRGMLVVKSAGTHLENAYIPVMNPMDFFKK
jgi:hypothetical protein